MSHPIARVPPAGGHRAVRVRATVGPARRVRAGAAAGVPGGAVRAPR